MLTGLTAKKLEESQVKSLVQNVLDDFSSVPGLRSIILFGSAAEGTMTEASDIDVLLIFHSEKEVNEGRKLIPFLRKKAMWPMDLLCTDYETYSKKSRIGGVYFVARTEGKLIWGEPL